MDSPDSTTPGHRSKAKSPDNNVNQGIKSLLESNQDTHDGGRPASPEANCVICLEKLQNKSFTDSCFHQFCYVCLLEWSKVKAECPLCKQAFKSIIHSVRSMEEYEQYYVPPPPPVAPGSPEDDFMQTLRLYDWAPGARVVTDPQNEDLVSSAFARRLRAFRDRSFLTFHNYYQPQTSNDIWGRFRGGFHLNRPPGAPGARVTTDGEDAWHVCQGDCPHHRRPPPSQSRDGDRPAEDEANESSSQSYQRYRQRREASSRQFRKYVYTRGLYSKPPPIGSRKRSTSPNFYSCNPATVHRLVPWLNRELGILLHENEEEMSKVLKEILARVKQHHMNSREFFHALRPHFMGRTEQFIHEFSNFASSPHDTLMTWDKKVQHEKKRPTIEEDPGSQEERSSSSEDDGIDFGRPSALDSTSRLRDLSPGDDVLPETPPRMTGRERTPDRPERGAAPAAIDAPSRSRDHPSLASPPPPLPLTPSRHRNLTPTPILQRLRNFFSTADASVGPDGVGSDGAAGSATSQSGWETPPWLVSASPSARQTQLSPSLETLKSEGSSSRSKSFNATPSPTPSDCEVVGFVKPLSERTPVEVTLSSDDVESDPDADIKLECRKKRCNVKPRNVDRPASRPLTLTRSRSRSRSDDEDETRRFLDGAHSFLDGVAAMQKRGTTTGREARRRRRRRAETRRASGSSSDSSIREVLWKGGAVTHTEVVIEVSSGEDDDVVIEGKTMRQSDSAWTGGERAPAPRQPPTEDPAGAKVGQSTSKPVSAKVWDFLESSRKDRMEQGESRAWDAAKEDLLTEKTNERSKSSRSSSGSRSRSPKKSSKGKGKGKGKGKSSTQNLEAVAGSIVKIRSVVLPIINVPTSATSSTIDDANDSSPKTEGVAKKTEKTTKWSQDELEIFEMDADLTRTRKDEPDVDKTSTRKNSDASQKKSKRKRRYSESDANESNCEKREEKRKKSGAKSEERRSKKSRSKTKSVDDDDDTEDRKQENPDMKGKEKSKREIEKSRRDRTVIAWDRTGKEIENFRREEEKKERDKTKTDSGEKKAKKEIEKSRKERQEKEKDVEKTKKDNKKEIEKTKKVGGEKKEKNADEERKSKERKKEKRSRHKSKE